MFSIFILFEENSHEKEEGQNWLNYIPCHAQQNLCVHHVISTFTLPPAIQNTDLILQQAVRKVCFAQLIPNIQLEMNQASILLRGNMVWSWSQLQIKHPSYKSC